MPASADAALGFAREPLDLTLVSRLELDSGAGAMRYLTTINVKIEHGDGMGIPYVAVVPGDPAASHLYDRMIKRDFWAMPPVGSEVVDPVGTALIKAWVTSLPK